MTTWKVVAYTQGDRWTLIGGLDSRQSASRAVEALVQLVMAAS